MEQNSQRISLAAEEELASIAWYIITILLTTREHKDLNKNEALRNTSKTNISTER